MALILASQSPRRKELLALICKDFTVRVADIDETMDPRAEAAAEVARVSALKAGAVPREAGDTVIAADTIVVCDGRILGKPKDVAQAKQMLHLLSGKAHQVMTGLTVLTPNGQKTVTEVTDVYFRPLTDDEIDAYVATDEPMDKAGAYGIQGGAAVFCTHLVGDYYNVMGLPVCRLALILRELTQK